MKPNTLLMAIDRMTSAQKYICWSLQEDDKKRKLEWLKESQWMIENAEELIKENIPF